MSEHLPPLLQRLDIRCDDPSPSRHYSRVVINKKISPSVGYVAQAPEDAQRSTFYGRKITQNYPRILYMARSEVVRTKD